VDDPTPLSFEYESQLPSTPGRPPKWVYAIAGIYLLLLAGLLTFPMWGPWLLGIPYVGSAILALAPVISGLTLMLVPVRAVRRRPVTRRSVWIPILGSGFLFACLVLGGGWALGEYFSEKTDITNQLCIAATIVWIFWSGIFITITFRVDPTGIGMKLHRLLIAGSLLELLVAVPTHVVVRRRPDCCAGVLTGMGICIGVIVMFVSFGPSVFLLFHARRRQITSK
jgi:hypothetical protein